MVQHVGNRIIADQDGEIIFMTGEMSGDVLPRKEITELHCIDLGYGAIDFSTHKIIGINIETKEPIIETLSTTETDEQRRIRELEDALLLQAENEIGGIL